MGITHPALYTHFANRREIFLAALDVLFERIMAVHRASSQENALERLREISIYHSKLVASAPAGFVSPLFEFIAASPEEGLRDALRTRQRALADGPGGHRPGGAASGHHPGGRRPGAGELAHHQPPLDRGRGPADGRHRGLERGAVQPAAGPHPRVHRAVAAGFGRPRRAPPSDRRACP